MRVAAGDRAPAVLAAVEADALFRPDHGQEAVRVSAGKAGDAAAQSVRIDVGAEQLPHLRAAVNSTLRLVQAAYESIGAAAPDAEPAGGGRRAPDAEPAGGGRRAPDAEPAGGGRRAPGTRGGGRR